MTILDIGVDEAELVERVMRCTNGALDKLDGNVFQQSAANALKMLDDPKIRKRIISMV